MKRFDMMRAECERTGVKTMDSFGEEVCGCNHDRACSPDDCPSLNYWSADRQIGYHAQRALELTELESQYEEEMVGANAPSAND